MNSLRATGFETSKTLFTHPVLLALLRRYNEVCKYNYQFNTYPQGRGKITTHFTQVVWAASQELGIGIATGKERGMTCYFVVGRYRIKGNWGRLSDYNKNVPKGSFTRTICSSLDNMVKEIESSVGDGGQSNAGGDAGGSIGGSTSKGSGSGVPGSEASAAFGGGAVQSAWRVSGTKFQREVLMAHNRFRKIHGTPEMRLNEKMNKQAQAYAEVLARNGVKNIRHSTDRNDDGENLAYSCSSREDPNFNGVKVTKDWLVEFFIAFPYFTEVETWSSLYKH